MNVPKFPTDEECKELKKARLFVRMWTEFEVEVRVLKIERPLHGPTEYYVTPVRGSGTEVLTYDLLHY